MFAISFIAANISFWLLRSLSASLSARRSKKSWSLLWLSCKGSTRSLLDSAEAAFAFFTAGAFPLLLFWNVLGFLLSSFRTPVPGLYSFRDLLEYLIQVKLQSHRLQLRWHLQPNHIRQLLSAWCSAWIPKLHTSRRSIRTISGCYHFGNCGPLLVCTRPEGI